MKINQMIDKVGKRSFTEQENFKAFCLFQYRNSQAKVQLLSTILNPASVIHLLMYKVQYFITTNPLPCV